jgi:hypothetical protein
MLGVAALSPVAGAGVAALAAGAVVVALLLGALALVSGVAVLALLLVPVLLLGVAALGEVALALDWLISLEVLEVLAVEEGGVVAPEVPVELAPQ